MRIHFSLTENTNTVPFDYQHFLIGVFHKWIGKNKIHDRISLYSLSWLKGGKIVKDGFDFPNGALWFISFWDKSIGKQLVKRAIENPDICCGMKVKEIQIEGNPIFSKRERFIASSPIFIRKYDTNHKAIHLTYKNEESNEFLTATLKRKLAIAQLNNDVQVSFDKEYNNPKTKLVKIKTIKSRANFCPVIIEGDPIAIQFAWNVGVGHSTGSCFGAIF